MFNVRSIIPVDNPLIFFLSEETKLYRLGRHGPRNERALALTLVHIVVAGFERFNSPPRRDEIKKQKLQHNTSPRHAICIVLWAGRFLSTVNMKANRCRQTKT